MLKETFPQICYLLNSEFALTNSAPGLSCLEIFSDTKCFLKDKLRYTKIFKNLFEHKSVAIK